MKRGTFIAFGNMLTAFPRMVDLIVKNINFLPDPIIIQAGSNVDLLGCIDRSARIFDYCSPSVFHGFLSNSKIVICHAGVGSVSAAINAGVRPAIIPRRSAFSEHVDDHQLELMQELVTRHIAYPVESREALIKYLNDLAYVIPNEADTGFFNNELMVHQIRLQLRIFISGQRE